MSDDDVKPSTNRAALPDGLDEDLWIRTAKHPSHNDYLIGNPHTFRGLMLAYCSEVGRSFSVYKSEIETMSDRSAAWIQGFLIGSEPEPPDDEYLPADAWERAVSSWEAKTRLFRATGRWPE